MSNPLEDQIRAICGAGPAASAPSTPTPDTMIGVLKFPVCAECGHVATWNPETEPTPKCKCGASFRMVAPSLEVGRRAAEQFMKAKATVPPSEPEAPQPDPTPTPATPKRTRRPVAPKPAEPSGASSTSASTAPGATCAAPTTGASVPLTGKELRENAEKALSAKLNPVSVVEVGQGIVDALGYTVWIEKDGHRLPAWNFKELTDTPESFKAELNAARRTDGNITIDVARVSGLEPIELRQARFQNLLIANLVGGNPTGRVSCMPGSKVRIGAKLTSAGRPVFFIMGLV